MLRFLTAPFREAFAALERVLGAGGGRALGLLLAGLLASYLVYVPLHELAHALACLAAGGEVSRLEISPLYGGRLLAKLVPWVVAESDYAGRLSGFDTHGSDLVYLATDLGPFLFTLWPGVWWMRRAARAAKPFWLGAAYPFALAPFLSATGDAYEIGSILLTRLPPWSRPELLESLRGDDLFLKISAITAAPTPALVAGVILASLLGLFWAFATAALAAGLASRLGEANLAEGSAVGKH
ncbi:MAG: hypothetical protein U0002_11245 [Thermoanaerobaculia bacterium]